MTQAENSAPSLIDPSGNLRVQSGLIATRKGTLSNASSSRPPTRLWLCVAVLMLLPILVHAPFLLGILTIDPLPYVARAGEIAAPWKGGSPFIDPNVGWQAQALGKLAADQWLSGQVPWWNSYNGVGLPLAAEAQPGALFLPFVLLYHFRLGIVWVEVLLQIIAGLSAFALLRKIRLTVLASFTGAVLYEFNGTFAWHGAPIISPIAFLPLLLLAIEYWYARIESNQPVKGAWIWIAPVLAWSLYAWFPETAYLNGLLAVIWVLVRLTDLERSKWWQYMRGLLCGVGCGLLLSLPLIIPLHEMINFSFIGAHDGRFAHISLPVAAAAHSLVPWLFGLIFSYNDSNNIIIQNWNNIGGYFPILQVLLALLGMWLVPRKLNFCLFGWMILCLTKTFDWRPISDVVNLIPLIKLMAVYRFSSPSWELAGVILCALAIHAIQSGGGRLGIRRRFALTALVVTTVSACLLMMAKSPIREIIAHGPAPWVTVLALVWWMGSVGLACVIFLVTRKRSTLAKSLTGLLVVDALFAFVMPMVFSSTRLTPPVGNGVAWLQSHVELQRIYGMGPIAPNYGAYFKLAQINHNYLPVPNIWASFVSEKLDPDTDKINFMGIDYPPFPLRKQTISAALYRNLANYEQIGVHYVAVAPGAKLFTNTGVIQTTLDHDSRRQQALPLGSNPAVTINLPLSEQGHDGVVNQIQILVGNYSNTADGALHVQVCNAAQVCVDGERPLSESIDNNLFAITLDHPLLIVSTSGETKPPALSVQIQQRASTHPVAIWMWPLAQSTANQGLTVSGTPAEFAGMGPDLEVQYAGTPEMDSAALVYQGRDMDIYELRHAKPYFEADDARCQLTPASRLVLDIQCPTVTTLTRKEMDYPGWRAAVDGQDTPIIQRDNLFQSIQIPAGAHRVQFNYTPSHRPLWLGGFLIGVLILLFNLWREFKARESFHPAPVAHAKPVRAE